MSEQNLTPRQRQASRVVRRWAFTRLPESCDVLRKLIDHAGQELAHELYVDPADYATVDAVMSRLFIAIRDQISHPFRDEQMALLTRLNELEEQDGERGVS